MKRNSKIIVSILIFSIICSLVHVDVKADSEIRKNYEVQVNGSNECTIMAMILNYDNNVYVSLKGIAYALRNTEKAFSAEVTGDGIKITTGQSFSSEPSIWVEEDFLERSKLTLARNSVKVDEIDRRYYSMIGNISDGKDAFMNPFTLSMMLDLDITVTDGVIAIDTNNNFVIKASDIEQSGYFQATDSLLIGDGTTGDVYLAYDEDEVCSIASTTKIMTYYLVMTAASNGYISLDDYVVLSKNAQELSEGIDGVIPMTAGTSVSVRELIYGMLLQSSNECALALAEHVSGSEAAFVDQMNEKADELGLLDAEFYNCNGLPVYKNQLIPAKMQNHMTANDMFKLASQVVKEYPEITEITSIKKGYLDVLQKDIKNTNAILYNVDQVKGLKTGTTNKSGACIVLCLPLEKDGEVHNVIGVLFGTEGEHDRATIGEMIARYAIDEFYGRITETQEVDKTMPKNPEIVVEKLVRQALERTKKADN